MKFIISFWTNINHQLNYGHEILTHDLILVQTNERIYDEYDMVIEDLTNNLIHEEIIPNVNGLTKVVLSGDLKVFPYHGIDGVRDADIENLYDVIFCSKCVDFTELKTAWLNIKDELNCR
jgi:hypothetical protein